jgi:radical SAM superfamily enzyme YgiQ (UPF0313 family)
MSTLYLEDISDLITETVDPYFGFSRYAESLANALSDFTEMEKRVEETNYLTTQVLEKILREKLREVKPELVAITIPFPGNLFAALKCGKIIKKINPKIKIAIGGGYCNTELRKLTDDRIFKYVDFITLDDGEAPIKCLLEYLDGFCVRQDLKRTFLFNNGVTQFIDGAVEKDVPQREVGTPDYRDLLLDKYLSILEVANPMHRLWSDGRWNKLTMAHGCYWGKCTFCDINLDYIGRYEPVSASILCDRIELMIEQTGERGFHFVDEAAPPALMRDLAIELLRRKIQITWWANIRFEKAFTPDLCRLLAEAGCVAISGGLEVASDRLLGLIQKGVTVEQVTRVAHAFTQAGVMVHAYLMYGFPTQTNQETIDSLEIVRQLFLHDIIKSGFWHRFTMTAHSPVGRDPGLFQVENVGPTFMGFAENDLWHSDPFGADHEKYSEGLRLSLYNYMNGLGLNKKLAIWFSFPIVKTTIPPRYIQKVLNRKVEENYPIHAKCCWIGGMPTTVNELGDDLIEIEFADRIRDWKLVLKRPIYQWFIDTLPALLIEEGHEIIGFGALQNSYEQFTGDSLDDLIHSAVWRALKSRGLLILR